MCFILATSWENLLFSCMNDYIDEFSSAVTCAVIVPSLIFLYGMANV